MIDLLVLVTINLLVLASIFAVALSGVLWRRWRGIPEPTSEQTDET